MRRLKLTRLGAMRLPEKDEYFPDDRCPRCGGRIGVGTTVKTSATITRYLYCESKCGFEVPNKLVESIKPAAEAISK